MPIFRNAHNQTRTQNNVAPNGHLSFPNVTESRFIAARTSWVGDEDDFSDWKVVIVVS